MRSHPGIARGQKRDFEGYEGRVLILDEVDALVIDEEPNEAALQNSSSLCVCLLCIVQGVLCTTWGGSTGGRSTAISMLVVKSLRSGQTIEQQLLHLLLQAFS